MARTPEVHVSSTGGDPAAGELVAFAEVDRAALERARLSFAMVEPGSSEQFQVQRRDDMRKVTGFFGAVGNAVNARLATILAANIEVAVSKLVEHVPAAKDLKKALGEAVTQVLAGVASRCTTAFTPTHI